MLKKFSVENYKCFDKKITIDFGNVSEYQFNKNCIKNDLLNKIIIFGKNGSGKSNLGLALFDIVQVLTDRQLQSAMLDHVSFLNINSDKNYASFNYQFKFNDSIVEYSYAKVNPTMLKEETLIINGKLIYKCDHTNKKIEIYDMEELGITNFNENTFAWNISFARYLYVSGAGKFLKEMFEFVNSMLWFRCLQQNVYIGLTNGSETLVNWIIEKNLVKDFQSFLKEFAGLDFELKAVIKEKPIPIKTLLVMGKKKAIYFDETASTGTKALMLFYYWFKHFDNVKFVFMDEFDAFYHFKLSENVMEFVIKKFQDVQAIFTSHNTILANNSSMRPDCCFMIGKGELKSFKESTTREIRESHNIEKLLRSGEFDEE